MSTDNSLTAFVSAFLNAARESTYAEDSAGTEFRRDGNDIELCYRSLPVARCPVSALRASFPHDMTPAQVDDLVAHHGQPPVLMASAVSTDQWETPYSTDADLGTYAARAMNAGEAADMSFVPGPNGEVLVYVHQVLVSVGRFTSVP